MTKNKSYIWSIDDLKNSPIAHLNPHLFNEEIKKEEPKKNKYNAKKVEVDGIVFDSKKEANRYRELKLLQQVGDIKELKLQVPFILGEKIKYIADFTYYDRNGKFIIEDTKSNFTKKLPIYILKKKLMLSVHGIVIKET
jgi:hypothetical protein